MGTRRRRSTVSSLDLFLDTICNAFGGIMFISILISILIQMRGDQSESTSTKDGIGEREARELQRTIEELQQKVTGLQQTVTDRERLLFNEESAEANALLDKKEQLMKDLEVLRQSQQTLLGATATKSQEIQKVQEDLRDLAEKIRDVRLAVSERSKELGDSLDAVETTTTLPKVSSTTKGNLMFAMRYGKLYLITDPDVLSSDATYDAHVTALDLGLVGIQVRLKPGAGWDLNSKSDMQVFRDVCSTHPKSSTFFSVVVYSDSHAEFGEWKEKLVSLGYDYDLVPVDNPESLMIVSSGSATVQ